MSTFQQQLNDVRQALIEEIRAANLTPKKTVLTNGIRIFAEQNRFIYRFEFSENFSLVPALSVRCTFGTQLKYICNAVVAEIKSQFVFLRFPLDLGEVIPEMLCEWNPADAAERLRERFMVFPPTKILESLLERKFSDNIHTTSREPIFPSTFSSSQLTALKDSIGRSISFVIGERKRGKTGVAASFILSSIREGKRILYMASSANSLHACVTEIINLNQLVAEEKITIFSDGLDLRAPLSAPAQYPTVTIDEQQREKLKQLLNVIFNEHEYLRVREFQKRLDEKRKQIAEATHQYNAANEELNRIQNLSLMEKMRLRIGKSEIEDQQAVCSRRQETLERLQEQWNLLLSEMQKKEELLPVTPKSRSEVDTFSSIIIPPIDNTGIKQSILSLPCVTTTFHQALELEPSLLANFDVVCIDDGQLFSMAEFLWMASLAKEQCVIFADATEQHPRSLSQQETARIWLQKNYFSYYQQEDGDYYRFMVNLLPQNVVTELQAPDTSKTIFESCLTAALDDIPVEKNTAGKIYFFDVSEQRGLSPQYIGKRKIMPYNEINAERVIDCIKHALLSDTITQDDIMVVVPQSGQLIYLRELLKASHFGNVEIAALGSIRICSKRIVIFDTTVAGLDFTIRQLDDRKFGLVALADTFNTLISTVQDELYIIADISHFQQRYNDRFITKFLMQSQSVSENIGNVLIGVRSFDDLPAELQTMVVSGTKAEKISQEYSAKLSAVKQQTPNKEEKLIAEIRSSCLRILAKRDHANTISQYFEAAPLYKITLETQQYYKRLPDFVCNNENAFRDIMDMWNVLIYETSQAQTADHPLSSKAKVESKLAAELQQIHSFYHSDLEMVVEEGKHRLASSIQKIFNDVIGGKPVTPTDWMNAYYAFLVRMEKYIDTIIDQIRM